MKIAILGTRGIPNHYGGFEQFAEYLSVGLVELGHEVIVYNSHLHPYQEPSFKGVQIVHCQDPEDQIGTAGQFIYDLNCILDSRKRNFDIILQLGYTSSSVWSRLFPKNALLTTNMDGLEWKRTKYSKPVQRFLRYAERLAIKHSDYLISDSLGIQQYLHTEYGAESDFIPYGANIFTDPRPDRLTNMNLSAFGYDLLIARLEPENSIETILAGAEQASIRPMVVVGNHETKYGAFLKSHFSESSVIHFVGGIYDQDMLNNLRYHSNIYFHGHTVGGTNPSLLEAMGCSTLICAHDNVFNKTILGTDALYFTNADQVSAILKNKMRIEHHPWIDLNKAKILSIYSWSNIIQQYNDHFSKISAQRLVSIS